MLPQEIEIQVQLPYEQFDRVDMPRTGGLAAGSERAGIRIGSPIQAPYSIIGVAAVPVVDEGKPVSKEISRPPIALK